MLYTPAMTTPTLGLQRELYRLFEGAVAQGKPEQGEWTPLVDIRETDRELSFAVEIAGSDASDVDVTTENGVLTIRGDRSEDWKDEGRYHLVERGYGSFTRRFQLPEGVDIDKIQADVENGLLQVRIPKSAMPQPKTIQVKTVAHGKNGGQLTNGRGESRQDAPATVTKARATATK
jgi:HSP20 family protein